MKKPVVIGLAVVVLAAVVAGGYWWYQSRQDNGLTLYGNVDIRTVNLSFRVGGRVESLAVDEGDAIKAGQVLGELDHKPYEIALMQAKAGVSVAQAQYDLMLAGYRDEEIAQAAAAVKQAQALSPANSTPPAPVAPAPVRGWLSPGRCPVHGYRNGTDAIYPVLISALPAPGRARSGHFPGHLPK